MPRSPRQLTKRKKLMGVPIGRRTTDWRKVGLLGVASTLAGGVGARIAARTRSDGSESDSGDERK